MATLDLRGRCKALWQRLGRDQMLRQGSPVDDIVEFVCAEVGRTASPALDEKLPLVLYFDNDADREEFIAAARAMHPRWRAKKV